MGIQRGMYKNCDADKTTKVPRPKRGVQTTPTRDASFDQLYVVTSLLLINYAITTPTNGGMALTDLAFETLITSTAVVRIVGSTVPR